MLDWKDCEKKKKKEKEKTWRYLMQTTRYGLIDWKRNNNNVSRFSIIAKSFAPDPRVKLLLHFVLLKIYSTRYLCRDIV